MKLTGKTVVLGITGGIAAYKACELASRLRKAGAETYVIMTKNACKFVAPLSFETLTNHPVVTDTFARPETWEVEHVALAKKADIFVIAPATANIMAKMACGIADDMLSTTVLATKAPVLVAPAMNTGMWENVATRSNVETLKNRGVHFVGPDGGYLACGDTGAGRMSEPEAIFDAICSMLCPVQDMAGLNVLVTAGPTRESLDPVRYITNHSSGKMGYAIAAAAQRRGANVTLLSGPVQITAPDGVEVVDVLTTQNLYDRMMERCEKQHIIIQAAAPADFTPVVFAEEKIKKNNDGLMTIELKETQDVAKAVGERKQKGQVLIGFAAETEKLTEHASKKLTKKNLDMIVANDVTRPGAGFNVDTNIVTFITKDGMEDMPQLSKADVAEKLLDRAVKLYRK
ncbi:MAG: bifunctional phosphopantothenoylcysteine decarboxylase/phosphopantothenate--cysteine ligase CoaBC [Clostridia bacterium]|nr:bifunctional phosphopantothenoylcysteine decarboxylase/phosphopantothenate--cysteine ligase CoaBC [Clostridia bacterium]